MKGALQQKVRPTTQSESERHYYMAANSMELKCVSKRVAFTVYCSRVLCNFFTHNEQVKENREILTRFQSGVFHCYESHDPNFLS